MGRSVELITSLHTGTRRDYLARMSEDKAGCSRVAREYGFDYWDGDRKYGYGGYRYDGRWARIAERLVELYDLREDARILDVGCGRAHLLFEFSRLLPNAMLTGFDISSYGIEHVPPEIRDRVYVGDAAKPFPYSDRSFDLVLSIMTLHNLALPELAGALREIERVGRNKFVAVESFRSVEELFNLQCWALTCETFVRPEGWMWLFEETGYSGDYEFAFFE